jgi:hypothetical protein
MPLANHLDIENITITNWNMIHVKEVSGKLVTDTREELNKIQAICQIFPEGESIDIHVNKMVSKR